MTIERKISNFFNLNDNSWLKHSNPKSVFSRYLVFPLMAYSFFLRRWIGWWSIIPIIISFIWMYINPILFKKPKTTKTWASKSVLGERVYLNRDQISIPNHHKRIPKILNVFSLIATLILIWGIIDLNFLITSFAILISYLSKSWYLDRMVWLFEDMKHIEKYNKWLY